MAQIGKLLAGLVQHSGAALEILDTLADSYNDKLFLENLPSLHPDVAAYAARRPKLAPIVVARHQEVADDAVVNEAFRQLGNDQRAQLLTPELGARLSDDILAACVKDGHHETLRLILENDIGDPEVQEAALSGRTASGQAHHTSSVAVSDATLGRIAQTDWGKEAILGSVNEYAVCYAWRRWGRDPELGKRVLANVAEMCGRKARIYGDTHIDYFLAACDLVGNRVSRRIIETAAEGGSIADPEWAELGDSDFTEDAGPADRAASLSLRLGWRALIQAADEKPIGEDDIDTIWEAVGRARDSIRLGAEFLLSGPDSLGVKLGLFDPRETVASVSQMLARILERKGTDEALAAYARQLHTPREGRGLVAAVGYEKADGLLPAWLFIEFSEQEELTDWMRRHDVDPVLFARMLKGNKFSTVTASDMAVLCSRH